MGKAKSSQTDVLVPRASRGIAIEQSYHFCPKTPAFGSSIEDIIAAIVIGALNCCPLNPVHALRESLLESMSAPRLGWISPRRSLLAFCVLVPYPRRFLATCSNRLLNGVAGFCMGVNQPADNVLLGLCMRSCHHQMTRA